MRFYEGASRDYNTASGRSARKAAVLHIRQSLRTGGPAIEAADSCVPEERPKEKGRKSIARESRDASTGGNSCCTEISGPPI